MHVEASRSRGIVAVATLWRNLCRCAASLALGLVAQAAPAQVVAPAAVQQTEAEGELVVIHQDDFVNRTSRTRQFLKTTNAELELQFRGRAPALPTGTRIRVKGTQSAGVLVLDAGGTSGSIQVVAPALTNTFGQQRTLVLLVNFQDQPTNQPWTLDQVRSVVFGPVTNYFLEASYQQTSLAGDAFGWYTIPVSSTTCDTTAIATASQNAATAAGVNVAAYARHVYFFPYNANCTWDGQGTVGGNPSDSWLNGSIDSGITAHEIGHNFGLYHSHALECDAGVLSGACSSVEYGDTLDTIGGGKGHFDAYQKENLGWLNYGVSPTITTVTTNGTYSLGAYETLDGGAKALKILKSTDPATGFRTWYYVEYRQPLGFDGFIASMPNSNVASGVVVHIGTEASPSSSNLLDMTPGSSTYWDWNDVALTLGQSFSDTASGVSITTAWANATNAGVSVALAQPACVHANPAVTLAPASQSGAAGAALAYTITLTNNDAASCGNSALNLAAALPTGWGGSFASQSVSLAPGASASTSLTVTSASGAAAGGYGIGISATNGGAASYSASTSATYQVVFGPTVKVATNQPSYSGGQTVNMNANVTSGGIALSGANVTFTVTQPNGKTATGSATTGSNGIASYALKLARRSAAGTYTVRALTVSGGVSGSGATSFQVQ